MDGRAFFSWHTHCCSSTKGMGPWPKLGRNCSRKLQSPNGTNPGIFLSDVLVSIKSWHKPFGFQWKICCIINQLILPASSKPGLYVPTSQQALGLCERLICKQSIVCPQGKCRTATTEKSWALGKTWRMQNPLLLFKKLLKSDSRLQKSWWLLRIISAFYQYHYQKAK